MNKIEILAPCGSMDSVFSAVRSGADAIYLGAKDFSARASAENFNLEQLKEAVEYCHINRVKIYLALNTVVFDSELSKVKDTIEMGAKAKIDALIVQNLGVAEIAKNVAPELPLHGSTQMSIHSLSGAKLLYEMGFKRVVLSREMSKEEIKEVADNCPIELEVFVHGALCMSVSGQCYFSGMLGSRSGNRGKCAQPCRLPFSVEAGSPRSQNEQTDCTFQSIYSRPEDRNFGYSKKGYALSLKDNSIVKYIKELEDMGVCSAKIEGRMKRPEYVSSAVKACVESRDFGFVSEETEKRLTSVFSRTGFTDGYYTGKRGYEMFGYRQKEDVVSATSKLLSEIRNDYNRELQRVKLEGSFACKIGELPELTLSDGEFVAKVVGESPCEKAINKPLDKERCSSQLKKTGGTPYIIENLEIDIDDNVALPMSSLNDLRRKAIEKLNEQRLNLIDYKINNYDIPVFQPYIRKGENKQYVRIPHSNLGTGFKQADLCFVPVFSDENELKRLIEKGFKIGVEIPRGLFGREKKIEKSLEKAMSLGIKDVLCNNLGAVYIAKKMGAKIHGGFGLNFTNTPDLLWAEKYGFEDTELSFELTIDQIKKLGGNIKRGIISYGYLPLMITRNCPNKSANLSCSKCKKKGKMTDRLNKSFIFYCDGCLTEVLNSPCLDVLDITEKLEGIDFEVFRISVENYVENVENILDFLRYNLKNVSKTQGLYQRGII